MVLEREEDEMVTGLAEGREVAKQGGGAPRGKGRPSQGRGEGIQVRLAPDIVAKLRYLSGARNESMADLANRLLRGPVEAMFRRAAQDITGAGQGPQEPGQGGEE